MRFYRRHPYRRRFRRKHVSVFKYKPIHIYTHRYRNSFNLASSSGFITVDDVKKSTKGNAITGYDINTTDFQTLFPNMYAPTTNTAVGEPYFRFSEELTALLSRYSKYKLLSVNSYISNFKFLQVIIRAKNSSVTDEELRACQDYFAYIYDSHENDVSPVKYAVDSSKFDVFYQYVDRMPLEILWRNHTTYTDKDINVKDITYGAGDAPMKVKWLHNKTVLKQLYYPKCRRYLDSNKFYGNAYNNKFKYWLDCMGVYNYPNLCYGRVMMGPEQYVHKDVNTATFNVIYFDVRVYYKFKFAGINNADIQ